jgi:Na+/H+-dicarboxylate symporter
MPRAVSILIALVAGLSIGIFAATFEPGRIARILDIADAIGTLWLNGLRMTIVPLIVALLITGIVTAARAARAGKLTARAVSWFIVLLWCSATFSAFVTPALLAFWPMPAEAGGALAAALVDVDSAGAVPGIGDLLRQIVPTNPFAAAAEDAILPLIVFTTIFAFAVTRLPDEPQTRLADFFSALADAMIIVIGWVLKLAVFGVFALAFVVGARAGASAFGALLHYVLLVSSVGLMIWMMAFLLAVIDGRIGLGRFARAAAPAMAVAVSTRSSLASLPATLRGAEELGIPDARSGVVLSLAVALFRVTGPAMNLAVAIYIAHWFGIEVGPFQLAAGIAAAAITTMGAVSIPGEASFFTSIGPIGLAMGLPLEPLALLIAVEAVPDIIRTLSNVTMNLAVTVSVTRRGNSDEHAPLESQL